uniref:hypothetical protein n=1 Tax=Glaucosphaera vacuolata TaxID=38265 RepID=UPI001FCD1244|nr:hypothetical protein MW444_pgp100 [Glaucosphaera vacuolata]UNJ18660.1 hypothetical protein [Glaucosphaera vacuolata]
MNTYYFALASQKFLLEEEPMEEILRERTNYYLSHNQDIDFWLLPNADDLKKFGVSISNKMFSMPLAAIVSTNEQFIDWIKLRTVHVYTGHFIAEQFNVTI